MSERPLVADDHVTKPFSTADSRTQVQAALGR